MKYLPFMLDVVVDPVEEVIWSLQNGGWIIVLSALIVIGAVIGIILFAKKKKDKEIGK